MSEVTVVTPRLMYGLVLATVSASGSIMPQAWAQTVDATQVSQSEANGLADIVVTATKRSQNLQDVPISISAMTGDSLKAAGIGESLQLAQQTPGLLINRDGANLTPFIRGVGTMSGGTAREQSVSVYLDGVIMPVAGGNIYGFSNLERVEVLRGPQGTLFGRNATGGLIHLITREPGGRTDVNASVAYDSYRTVNGQLYATTDVTEGVAADISLSYANQDKPFGRNVTTGNPLQTREEATLRTKWLMQPTDTTKITAWFMLVNSDGARFGRQFVPGAVGLDGTTTYTGKFRDITGGIDPYLRTRQRIGALNVEQEMGGVSLRSISAYQRFRSHQRFDNDATALAIVDVDDYEASNIFTQELQLLSGPDSPFKWIVGAYYLNDKSGYPDPGLGLFGSGFGGGGVALRYRIKTTSYAGFVEATVPLGALTNITGGLRYTSDKRRITGALDVLDGIENWNVLATVPLDPASKTFNKLTYRVIADHRFSDQLMAYASYSLGFKSGNFNVLDPASGAFKPETLNAYEVGIKSNLFDNSLRLNLSAFQYDYQDIQLAVFVGTGQKLTNATSAKVKGVEVEGEARVSSFFRIGFGGSYLDAKIGRFTNAICQIPAAAGDVQVPCDASGNSLPRAPKVTFNLAPRLNFSALGGDLRFEASYYYNDGFAWDFSNIRRESAYSVVNATVGWFAPKSRYGVELFVQNLTKANYAEALVAHDPGDQFAPNLPRTFGIRLTYNLGDR